MRRSGPALGLLAAALLGSLALPAPAAPANLEPVLAQAAPDNGATRSGREIYQRFREGLADPTCAPDASTRWRKHFAAAPKRLASAGDDVLPLFGYVVDALREAHLPTEYALIPFVESGYKPGARSPLGPAGLWQMIKLTARNHHVPIRKGYDGRLSPVDSTKAAVRYLKTLHGMFAGDWRLAAMAYNAGEYRIFGALKRGGQIARDAQPEKLSGLSGITHAYVRKLHALACVLEQAEAHDDWVRAIDRPVPRLQAIALPADARNIDDWAARYGQDAKQLRRLNPAFVDGRIGNVGNDSLQLLALTLPARDPTEPAPAAASAATTASTAAVAGNDASDAGASAADPRQHTVVRGDSAWTIAKRHGVRVGELLERNGLAADSVLRPGMVLQIDAAAPRSE